MKSYAISAKLKLCLKLCIGIPVLLAPYHSEYRLFHPFFFRDKYKELKTLHEIITIYGNFIDL